MKSIRSSIASWVALALLLAACEAGTVTDSSDSVAPPSGPNPPGGGGTIQRGSLRVRVYVDPSDQPLASAVGISTTGLTVRLTRPASSEPPRTAVTGADGSVVFDGLLQGRYQVSTDRQLTQQEIQLLPADDREISLFAAGNEVTLSPPAGDIEIGLVAARRGTLVVSEIYEFYVLVPGAGTYGHYIEIHNSADTTIYLDQMLLFRTHGWIHSSAFCPVFEEKRLDPTAVWASMLHRFPGGGQSYPIRPGEAKVIAIDAIDHRPLGDGMQDLRLADFEIIGRDVDPNNPFAADIRMKGFLAGGGHGETLQSGVIIGLALPIAQDTNDLLRDDLRTGGSGPGPGVYSAFRIPRDAVIDLAGFKTSAEWDAAFWWGSTTCTPFASPVIERAPAAFMGDRIPMAISRKSLGRTTTGVEILQRTRNSSRDFERAYPLLRSLLRPR